MTIQTITDEAKALLDEADTLLTQKEPARAIGYGSAAVVVGIVALSNALGFTRFGSNLDFQTALGLTATGIVTLTTIVEGIRHYVFAPATVAALTGTPPAQ